jgi:hypothetical protein
MIELLPVEKTLTRLISDLEERAGVKPEEFSKVFESTLVLSLEDSYKTIRALAAEKGKMSEADFEKWFQSIIKDFYNETGLNQ